MGSSNAIASKAKAMYAKRLKDDDYRALLKKSTVGEVASYLKNETDYASALRDVKENNIHRGELETLLNRDLYYKELRLATYAPIKERSFYKATLREIEIHRILTKIKQVTSSLYSEMFSTENFHYKDFCFDQNLLEEAKTYDEVAQALVKTPYYKIVLKYRPQNNHTVDYVSLEKEMDQLYDDMILADIEKYLKGKDKQDALTIYLTAIELRVITKIYRLKKYYHSSAESILKYVDFSHIRMNKLLVDELIHAQSGEEVLALLEKSKYHFYMDEKEYIYIEYYAEKIKYNLSKRIMRFSSSPPLVFMTYIILHQIEIMNLVNIVEGIRYGMNEEQIEKTCIF